MIRSPVPQPKPAMITMNPMTTKINMKRSPGPKPDMISMILMKPTNTMKTTYEDESISKNFKNERKELIQYKNLKNQKKSKNKIITKKTKYHNKLYVENYPQVNQHIFNLKQEKIIKSKKHKKNIRFRNPNKISQNPAFIQKKSKNIIEKHTSPLTNSI